MERIAIYLDRDVYQYVRCYGTIEEVVNKLLDLSETQELDVYNKPACPPVTKDCVRCNITVRNMSFLSMRAALGFNNPMVSIRRMLYWFVDEAIGNQLGWKRKPFVDREKQRMDKFFDDTELSLKNIYLQTDSEVVQTKIKAVLKALKEIKNELQQHRSDKI